MGEYLSTHKLKRAELRALARAVERTPRTLWNWRRREGQTGSPGRPGHSREARADARTHTERVWRLLPAGQDGWRSVRAELEREGRRVPARLIQESLRALREQAVRKERTRIEKERVHVEVLMRDAVWALDKAQVGSDEIGRVEAQAVRECLVPRTLALSVGPPPKGKDTVQLLEAAARERGAWPFVLQMDNGSENKNQDVEAWLVRHRVIALWNVPHTPQHNPRAERVLGSLKRASGVSSAGAGGHEPMEDNNLTREPGVWAMRTTLCGRLLEAWCRLDAETPREELCGLTPAELDSLAPRADDHVRRARFYAEVCQELEHVALAPRTARARRKLEREVVWRALERHQLVTRSRGGCPLPTIKAEGIS